MNIEYVGRHVELDDRIRTRTEEKLARVTKFLSEPIDVHVALDVERHRQIAEIRVKHRRGSLHAREENNDLLEAIDLAGDHLERQAKRQRKRAVDRRRRAGRNVSEEHHWPVDVLTRESLKRGQTPQIVKSSRFEIKPMSLDEAALQLEDSTNEFVVFLNADTERVCVLYKRRDEHYGLIEPEA
jgi:putative sigma-54 modulation protein